MSEIKRLDLVEKVFALTEENVKSVHKYYNKTQEEIDRDCEIIKEWMKQQAHFPDDYDKRRIERFLLRNKFRVEHTKRKLESYYTDRYEQIYVLKNRSPCNDGVTNVFKTMTVAPLPKLMNRTDRVFIYRLEKNEDLFCLEHHVIFLQALTEIEVLFDYAVGIRCIIDYENLTMTHIKRIDLNTLSRIVYLYQQIMSGRVLSIDYINLHSALNLIMNIVKLSFPEKLYNKIRIHSDLDSLTKCIPVEFLPSEYGGKLRSMYDINEDVKEFYMQNKEFFDKRMEVISDESKRVGGVKKNELFGAEGTFKKINLD